MSWLDVFTGESAKDAAAENSLRLDQLKAEGMGYLDTGKSGALSALNAAKKLYAPISRKYGAGTDLYLDSLGVNGPQGNANAVDAFQAGPGFDFALNTGLDALDRRAASRGMLASGNDTIDTLGYANGLANQEYNNWQTKLAGLIQPELTGVTGQATAQMAKAPVYVNDANARVGLASGVTNGLNSQTTQAANAELAGSGNLWNLGLNLAKLGVGAFGGLGGTSMLGGAQGGLSQSAMGGGYGGDFFR